MPGRFSLSITDTDNGLAENFRLSNRFEWTRRLYGDEEFHAKTLDMVTINFKILFFIWLRTVEAFLRL